MVNVRAALKNLLIRTMPVALSRYWLRAYYLRKLRNYDRSNAIAADERELNVVQRLVRPGDTVFDVGANFGYHTLFLSKFVGPQGVVHSLEPVPLTFDILSHGVARLSLRNVRPFNCGISDQERIGIMEIPRYSSGADNFYQAHLVSGDAAAASSRVAVTLKPLDAFLPSLRNGVSFIKIDVEGHEWSAIGGAAVLLERYRPALLIEVSGDPDAAESSSSRLFAKLARLGYAAFWYDGRQLHRRRPGEGRVNYFFLTEQQLEGVMALRAS